MLFYDSYKCLIAISVVTLSPRCEGSCFVIVTSSGEITGTTFAISADLLLTAGQCVLKSSRYYIAPHVSKIIDPATSSLVVTYPHGRSKVEVRVCNVTSTHTYAVLHLVNEDSPAFPTFALLLTPIPIHPVAPVAEDRVKSYFAFNATEFNESSVPAVSGVGGRSEEKINFASSQYIMLDRRRCDGGQNNNNNNMCSGGPYIMNIGGVGHVVALHVDSSHDVEDINAATSLDGVEITQLHDVVNDAMWMNSDNAAGLVILWCFELCEFLRGQGVAI